MTVVPAPALPALDVPGLDRDTRLLSGLLEETIARQGGESLRSAVVRLHQAAARVRAGEPEADDEAAAIVEEILAGDSLDVISIDLYPADKISCLNVDTT